MEWEKHNGDIPDGCNIVFKDNNKDNVDISNLMLVTKAEREEKRAEKLSLFSNAELEKCK